RRRLGRQRVWRHPERPGRPERAADHLRLRVRDHRLRASTAPVSAGAGMASTPASADIAGLSPGTTYHYRLNATNPANTTSNAHLTFTTLGVPPPPAPTTPATPSTP